MIEATAMWAWDMAVKAVPPLFVAAAGYMMRLNGRVQALESKNESLEKSLESTDESASDYKKLVNGVLTGHTDHAERLAVIESVIKDLKELSPVLRDIAKLTGKMDGILEAQNKRLELVEDLVFRKGSK